jgi:serine protease Do
VVITQMSRGSAAYEAGLRPGDIIKTVNGQAVENTSQFVRLIADSPIGSTARIEYLREGKPETVRIAIERQQPRQQRRGR